MWFQSPPCEEASACVIGDLPFPPWRHWFLLCATREWQSFLAVGWRFFFGRGDYLFHFDFAVILWQKVDYLPDVGCHRELSFLGSEILPLKKRSQDCVNCNAAAVPEPRHRIIQIGKIGNISHRGNSFMFILHRRLDKFFYHTLNLSVFISHFVISC